MGIWKKIRKLLRLKNKKLYDFVDIGTDTTGVVVLEGKYRDMVWEYGKVSFDEGENLNLSFDYSIHENPNNIKPSDELHNFMGELLVDIIKSELDSNVN